MPEYCFVCNNCGSKWSEVRPMVESGKSATCAICHGPMRRDFGNEAKYASTDYAKPLISDSLAMHPDQIAEHNRRFPDIKVHSDGRPQFDNPKQHDKYLKETGFVKAPKKRKRSQAKRI